MEKFKEYILVWSLGALMYSLVEIMWRGYTHWSMMLTGGVCFLILYKLAPLKYPLAVRAILGAVAITAVEFAVGVTVNLIFRLDVWDYSMRPLNILGQICPLYSIFWFFLCLAAMPLCRYLQKGYKRLIGA